MSSHPFLPPLVETYVTQMVTRETLIQKRLREATSQIPGAGMQTTPDQVAFLAMLLKMLNAKYILEIGTFTGYGALAMAMALPEDGKLIACDIRTDCTDLARQFWQEAGVAHKIDLRIGPAQDTLRDLLNNGAENRFDFAFIDADKQGYDAYYELCLKLLRPGGVIAFDNMLWGGDVADPEVNDNSTKALRALNAKIRDDDRVDMSFVTVADGVMLARKR